MSVALVLFIILFILMSAVGGIRGIKSFITLILNFSTLFVVLSLMALGLDPLKTTIVGCVAITAITLFYISGFNRKTFASLVSVVLVVLITLLLTYQMGTDAKIQGFSKEQAEGISYLSPYVHLDFSKVVISGILIGLLGAIIDVAISIASSMNEILKNNPAVTRKTLFKSGITIGKDILGTMANTLFFAYIGGFTTLIIWFNVLHYSWADILNAKVFCSEVFQILTSGIGIVLIIPVTALITALILFSRNAIWDRMFQSSEHPEQDGQEPPELETK